LTGSTGWGPGRAPGTGTPPRRPGKPGRSAGASPAPDPFPPFEVAGNPAGPAPDQAQSHPLSTAKLHSCLPLGSAAKPSHHVWQLCLQAPQGSAACQGWCLQPQAAAVAAAARGAGGRTWSGIPVRSGGRHPHTHRWHCHVLSQVTGVKHQCPCSLLVRCEAGRPLCCRAEQVPLFAESARLAPARCSCTTP